jgi:hypothetical protein
MDTYRVIWVLSETGVSDAIEKLERSVSSFMAAGWIPQGGAQILPKEAWCYAYQAVSVPEHVVRDQLAKERQRALAARREWFVGRFRHMHSCYKARVQQEAGKDIDSIAQSLGLALQTVRGRLGRWSSFENDLSGDPELHRMWRNYLEAHPIETASAEGPTP